jgi:hypothetical protein
MQSALTFDAMTDDELLRRLSTLVAGSRHTEADLVAHIGEVDARRLYLREATPSMFVYCTERLHLSETEAGLRIAAARAARRHAGILEMLADGRLHLSAIARLAPHLTPENRDDLLRRATHRTKREVEELVAGIAPRADVPATIRKLPAGRLVVRKATQRVGLGLVATNENVTANRPQLELRPEQVDSGALDGVCAGPEHRPEQVDSQHLSGLGACAADLGPKDDTPRPDAGLVRVPAPLPGRATIEPLSPARYRVQFTASAQLRDKLERLRALMRPSIPDGDLAAVIEATVTEKLQRLEARRFGRTPSPRTSVSTTDTSPRTRHVPTAVRRHVHERDGGQCRFVDAQDRRCPERGRIELHHRIPWGVGGDHSPGNVAEMCSVHNAYLAELDYGRKTGGKRRRPNAVPVATPIGIHAG